MVLLPEPRPAHLNEVTVSTRTVYQGDFLHAKRDLVKLPDDTQATREYIVHPGAVMVVPLLDDGRMVVERQFRYPIGRAMIEFPAGKLDPGERSLDCARRELLEETGYVASQWARAGELHPVISYATEVIHIWFARGLSLQERSLDAGEFLDVLTVEPETLLNAAQDGLVTDAKTLTGLLWWQNVTSGRWSLDWQTL